MQVLIFNSFSNIIINGDFMKKYFIILFVSAVSLFLCSCELKLTKDYPKPVIILPDDEAANTVNGYKTEKPITESYDATSSDDEMVKIKYIGNKNSKKYHTATCRYAKNLKEENMVIFETLEQATLSGYIPCSICGN